MSAVDFSSCPIIAAVKNEAQLKRALETDCEIIFLLFGNILNIASLTEAVREKGRRVIVHLDLINGLSSREIAVDFIARTTSADGIISTKPSLIRRAGELGLATVLRVFVIDSMALENISRELESARPDVMEILPGVVPEVIKAIHAKTDVPLIAGGLISTRKDILAALGAGAIAVSTTNEAIWEA